MVENLLEPSPQGVEASVVQPALEDAELDPDAAVLKGAGDLRPAAIVRYVVGHDSQRLNGTLSAHESRSPTTQPMGFW